MAWQNSVGMGGGGGSAAGSSEAGGNGSQSHGTEYTLQGKLKNPHPLNQRSSRAMELRSRPSISFFLTRLSARCNAIFTNRMAST